MLENATRHGQKHGPIEKAEFPLPDPKSWSEHFWAEITRKQKTSELEARRNARSVADVEAKALEAMQKFHGMFFTDVPLNLLYLYSFTTECIFKVMEHSHRPNERARKKW